MSKAHSKCMRAVDYPPFGSNRSCTRSLLQEIIDIVEKCHAQVPFVSLQLLLTSLPIDQLDTLVASHFPTPGSPLTLHFYTESIDQIKRLREINRILSTTGNIHSNFVKILKHHHPIPSDHAAFLVLRNLNSLDECIVGKMEMVENALWESLDDYPDQAKRRLKILMNRVSSLDTTSAIKGLKHVRPLDFMTLNVGCWVNDEIVNYFVTKWCAASGHTLGLSSFFAPKCLFLPGTSTPRNGYLTKADEATVERWCRKAMIKQNLQTWDSVFIPINENRAHWFSARIDFQRKRIDIYDSLQERCLNNREKPPLLRRNANLMLVLLWVTEVFSRIRGKEIDLKKNAESGWVFDPHFKV
ncbi:hypothetical protein D9757_003153 [Collybiopsis confluens]|uniref:Ubiquitin-like protease family profile domain-containing protein n=1 Tax=Collybiopsis confluens TaxID=2823264 RepID=A0A8H5HWX0_9AGAR|nr:hypothetical protein D9757_003153 [Collybiopsis confluens]